MYFLNFNFKSDRLQSFNEFFFGKMVGNLCSPEVDLRTGSLITRDFFLSRHKIHFKVDLLAFYIFCLFFRVLEDNPHQTSGIDIQSMQTFKRWIKSPWSVKCLVKAPPFTKLLICFLFPIQEVINVALSESLKERG